MGWFDGIDKLLAGGGALLGGSILGPIGATALVPGVSNLVGQYLDYQQQQKNYDWQKYQQQMTWNREDTSVQRRVQDLKAAGLSPVLAAGQGASAGAVVSTQAPQLGPMRGNPLQEVLQMLTMGSQIDKTKMETRAAEQSIIKNKVDMDNNTLMTRASVSKAFAEVQKILYDLGIAKKTGTSTHPGGMVQQLREVMSMFDNMIPEEKIPSKAVYDEIQRPKHGKGKVNTPYGLK